MDHLLHHSHTSSRQQQSRLSADFRLPPGVQRKLQVGSAHDPQEREADSVAEQVVNQKGNTPLVDTPVMRLIQRKCAACAKEDESAQRKVQRMGAPEEEEKVQMKGAPEEEKQVQMQRKIQRSFDAPTVEEAAVVGTEGAGGEESVQRMKAAEPQKAEKNGNGFTASSAVSEKISRSAGRGEPLPQVLRQQMEGAIGADFSGVRLHADTEAVQLSRDLNAQAFTYGNDIYFNSGKLDTGSDSGKKLLAHELTHTVQQGASPVLPAVQRKMSALKVQRMGALGPVITYGVRPWPAFAAPTGDNHTAPTDAGTNVTVWAPNASYSPELMYWCHGHSLGTYSAFGYTVYSGPPLMQVITDEWNAVLPQNVRQGDIAVWTAGWDHSARIETPVMTGGTLDHSATMLSSKNGRNALANYTLDSLKTTYGSTGIQFFRHK